MDPQTLFKICNYGVLPAWLMLVLLPRWKWTTTVITPVVFPGLLGLVYLYLAVVYFRSAEGSFGSLTGVASFFENPHVLLAGWIHYLAFDLFIGSWQVRDAQRSGVRHWFVVPCLFLTLMLGPVGLVTYLTIRTIATGKLQLEAASV